MLLRSATASPFGRKVKIAASVLGLSDRIEVVATNTTDPADPIRSINPLGKIPALELENGTVLFDSRVIVDYLDWLAGGAKIIPAEPQARFAQLRLQALCDGICDAALLTVYESRFRPEELRSAQWVENQAGKVSRGLTVLEASPPAVEPLIGQIALASALGYLDLRFEGRWRGDHPRLVAWLDAFREAVPAYDRTAPH